MTHKDEFATLVASQADELYKKEKYSAALAKYTVASDAAPNTPDLLAKVADCLVIVGRYDDAITAAKQALEIDPKHIDAWCYLADAYFALEEWNTCFEAFDRALALLAASTGKYNSRYKKLRRAYGDAQKRAEARRKEGSKRMISTVPDAGTLPWERAAIVKEEVEKGGRELTNSSALVILEANQDFKRGLDLMSTRHLVSTSAPDGSSADNSAGVAGHVQAITFMTNGILRDDRCFYMLPDFMARLKAQASFEILAHRAWDLSTDESKVIQEAQTRLKGAGWNDVRPAIAATIRIWMINAHISQGLTSYGQALGLYRRVLAVLDWGRKEWGKVDRKQRGAIFDSTFARGVRVLYASTLIRAYEHTLDDLKSPFSLRDIISIADDIIKDCRNRPVRKTLSSGKPTHPSYNLSYQDYPEGKARMYKGFYYLQSGRSQPEKGKQKDTSLLRMASNEFMNASSHFPQDDEYFCLCISNALEAAFLAATPVRDLLGMLKKLREAWTQASQIWSSSSFANGGGKKKMETLLKFEEDVQHALKEKNVSMIECIAPGSGGNVFVRVQ